MIGGLRNREIVFIKFFMYIFGIIAVILLITGYAKNISGHTDQYKNLTTPGWVFFSITGALGILLL